MGKFNNVDINKHLQKMLTDDAGRHNILHEPVNLKVLFFTQKVQENDNEVDSAVISKQIELFLVDKSKEISKGKTGSAVLPGSVQLGRQLEILLRMLHDGKRNKSTDMIRYTEPFGNDCQNPFTLETDEMWPESPTYLSWEQFWETLYDPTQQNIQRLVSKFALTTTRRPVINNVHPNQEETVALKLASEKATRRICPPFVLTIDNVFRDPLYRGRQKYLKARGKKRSTVRYETSYPIDAAEVNMVVVVAATAKFMYMAANGKTEAQWNKKHKQRCKDIVVTALCLLNCTAKTSVCGGSINAKLKEQLNLPGGLRKSVLDFAFGVAHACMWMGSLFNVCTYATNGKQVLEEFIEALKLVDMEEGYRGDEVVVKILGERDVFLTRSSQQIRNSLI